MTSINTVSAIWVKFTPYMIDWMEEQFGTGLSLCGRPVLELRSIPGIKELMRSEMDEDLVLNIEKKTSLSQLRYDVLATESQLRESLGQTCPTPVPLDVFRPVSAPGYVLTTGGVIRKFSRLMQLRHRTASQINKKVYHAFWWAVRNFAMLPENHGLIDLQILTAFCEMHQIAPIHIDDLRNQYQRLKRSSFFVNGH